MNASRRLLAPSDLFPLISSKPMTRFAPLFASLLALLLLWPASARGQSATLYVKPDADGDCSTWDNACGLQDALGKATGEDEIWVAQGVYTPGAKRGDRFTLTGAQDGLEVYGGFDGSETNRSDRDVTGNAPVVLSGDIGTSGDASDNNYHVIFLDGADDLITPNTVLNGVTISGGNADGAPGSTDARGGGLYCDGSGGRCNPTLKKVLFTSNRAVDGGAFYGNNSDPRIADAVFSDNSASGNGGAMANVGGPSFPQITNTVFSNNDAGGDGGAIFNEDGAEPRIVNAVFFGNSASGDGGATANVSVSPTITNVTFHGNDAGGNGGAIFNEGGASTPTITNTILYGNGGEIFNTGGAGPTVTFSLVQGGHEGTGNFDAAPRFADPTDPDGADDTFATADDGLRLAQGSPALDAGTIDPLDGNNDGVADVVTQDITNTPLLDREEDDDGDGTATVDFGAYETAANAAVTIHVDLNATGLASGASWTDAFPKLYQAVSTATPDDEIWIGGGAYYPRIVNTSGPGKTKTFTLERGVEVYGGFDGSETSRSDRDVDGNAPVILSGDTHEGLQEKDGAFVTEIFHDDAPFEPTVDSDGDPETATQTDHIKSNNSCALLELAASSASSSAGETVIDGLTITAAGRVGYTSVNCSTSQGLTFSASGDGGESSPTIRNVRFQGNHGETTGGALRTFAQDGGVSNPHIINTTFNGNYGEDGGGAVWYQAIENGSVSNPVFENVTFTGNATRTGGGAIVGEAKWGAESSATFTNSTFTGNSALVNGGAIKFVAIEDAESTPTIRNSTFTDNSVGDPDGDGAGGAVMATTNGSSVLNVQITGATFRGNQAADKGGAINLSEGSATITGATFTDNEAGFGGGAISFGDGNFMQNSLHLNILNTVFTGNSVGPHEFTPEGGALRIRANDVGDQAIINSTFAGNSAGVGGAIYRDGGHEASTALTNSILWGNTASNSNDGLYNDRNSLTVAHSLVQGSGGSGAGWNADLGADGGGNLDADPQFVDVDGDDGTPGTDDDNLRLRGPGTAPSPAIDAGDNAPFQSGGVAESVTRDHAGSARLLGVDGLGGSGEVVDLGAYESTGASRPAAPVASSSASVSEDGAVDLPGTGAGLDFSGVSSGGTATVTKYPDAPADAPGISESTTSSYRFVIEAEGGLRFTSADVRLDVSSIGGIDDPTKVTIYRRATPGSGDFSVLPTSVDDSGTPGDLSDDVLVATTNSFSEFVLASNSQALPVELAGFDASTDGASAVRLSWETVTESGNARFRAERRSAADGGRRTADDGEADSTAATWTRVASVESKAPGGTSSEPLRYVATDSDLPFEAQALTYRLVQIDRDGTETVAAEKTVEIGAPQSFTLHGSFPNPMRERATIRYELPEARDVTVAVYDALGRKVKTLVAGEEQRGRQELSFQAEGLASGVYFYRITAGDYAETRKLVLVR